jgi:hypothetical protein
MSVLLTAENENVEWSTDLGKNPEYAAGNNFPYTSP